MRPLKAPSFLLWTKITALYKKHAETPSSVVSCEPSNKFLFPLKIINIFVCMRDLGNTDLHCFFLHRDMHFPHKKVAAPCNRTIFCMNFMGSEISAMERFGSVTYQHSSSRMNATYQQFMPKRGDLPIHRRGFMQRKPARGRKKCWFSLHLKFVCSLCL